MKNLLLAICLLLLGATCRAQSTQLSLPVDSATQKVSYSGVLPVAGVSQANLYARARHWFATEFKSANSVLQLEDPQTGSLIGKGTTEVALKARILVLMRLRFTLSVDVKDGRYRYELTSFQNESGSGQPLEELLAQKAGYRNGQPTADLRAMSAAIDTEAKSIVARLQQGMQRTSAEW